LQARRQTPLLPSTKALIHFQAASQAHEIVTTQTKRLVASCAPSIRYLRARMGLLTALLWCAMPRMPDKTKWHVNRQGQNSFLWRQTSKEQRQLLLPMTTKVIALHFRWVTYRLFSKGRNVVNKALFIALVLTAGFLAGFVTGKSGSKAGNPNAGNLESAGRMDAPRVAPSAVLQIAHDSTEIKPDSSHCIGRAEFVELLDEKLGSMGRHQEPKSFTTTAVEATQVYAFEKGRATIENGIRDGAWREDDAVAFRALLTQVNADQQQSLIRQFAVAVNEQRFKLDSLESAF